MDIKDQLKMMGPVGVAKVLRTIVDKTYQLKTYYIEERPYLEDEDFVRVFNCVMDSVEPDLFHDEKNIYSVGYAPAPIPTYDELCDENGWSFVQALEHLDNSFKVEQCFCCVHPSTGYVVSTNDARKLPITDRYKLSEVLTDFISGYSAGLSSSRFFEYFKPAGNALMINVDYYDVDAIIKEFIDSIPEEELDRILES